MSNVIELLDAAPFHRWCTPEDVDLLVQSLLAPDVRLPTKVVSMHVNGADKEHFRDGSVLVLVCTKSPCRVTHISQLRRNTVQVKLINYSTLLSALTSYVHTWFEDIPVRGHGRLDIRGFSLLDCWRFIGLLSVQ